MLVRGLSVPGESLGYQSILLNLRHLSFEEFGAILIDLGEDDVGWISRVRRQAVGRSKVYMANRKGRQYSLGYPSHPYYSC